MASVRQSRNFRGNGPISLVALSKLERRQFPVSVRALIATQGRTFTTNVTSGDVSANVTFSISTTGNWSATAQLHDDGTFTGDSFVLELELTGALRGVGTKFEGQLDEGQDLQLTNQGIDPFVREHFFEITGGTAHLHVSPDIAGIIEAVTIGLIVAVAVVFFAGPGKTEARPCSDQGPFDNNNPCVEFHKVGS